MTAMSWNSSTEKMRWPPAVLQQPLLGQGLQHDRGRRHREDQADRERDAATPTPTAMPTRRASTRCRGTCAPPRPTIGRRACARAAPGRSSRPTRNSIITTPNSAKCMTSSLPSGTRPQHERTDGDAGDQVAEHRAEAEPLGDRHGRPRPRRGRRTPGASTSLAHAASCQQRRRAAIGARGAARDRPRRRAAPRRSRPVLPLRGRHRRRGVDASACRAPRTARRNVHAAQVARSDPTARAARAS